MQDGIIVYGFQRSTFVNIVRLILTEKGAPFRFHDTEDEMYAAKHRMRHPFGRVPVLQHGDFLVYETSAIAAYLDEVLPGPRLTPADPRQRARMNQWISNLNTYFYPYMIYHVGHERGVFPQLGIAAAESIVQRALPRCEEALAAMEQELEDTPFLVGDRHTLADFFLLPTIYAFGLTPEGKALYPRFPRVQAWDRRVSALPSVVAFRATLPPRDPIPHAREWVKHHRPPI
jgi:glutathione S-transferase